LGEGGGGGKMLLDTGETKGIWMPEKVDL